VSRIPSLGYVANIFRIVRMSSWRGRTTISGEWISSDFDDEMIVRFLGDVVSIMLSLVEE
jgi:hypothetical protein